MKYFCLTLQKVGNCSCHIWRPSCPPALRSPVPVGPSRRSSSTDRFQTTVGVRTGIWNRFRGAPTRPGRRISSRTALRPWPSPWPSPALVSVDIHPDSVPHSDDKLPDRTDPLNPFMYFVYVPFNRLMRERKRDKT